MKKRLKPIVILLFFINIIPLIGCKEKSKNWSYFSVNNGSKSAMTTGSLNKEQSSHIFISLFTHIIDRDTIIMLKGMDRKFISKIDSSFVYVSFNNDNKKSWPIVFFISNPDKPNEKDLEILYPGSFFKEILKHKSVSIQGRFYDSKLLLVSFDIEGYNWNENK